YFQLAWVPECDALRAEVALLRTGQGACDEGVETWSLEVLAETLTDHFLSDGEKLLPVHLDGKANQRIGIFDHEGNQTGWVHLKEQQLWRTDYGTEVRHGAECQLTTNYSWDCAKG
ncbi:MAG: hypothetical protein KDH89_18520, partial [Anaerolineae bacterium]|nr:hypothetical protein [Anaerolineae bacterium]